MRRPISKERDNLLFNIQESFQKKTRTLQNKFYRSIVDYFSDELIINDTVIKNVSKNYLAINNIGLAQDSFRKNEVRPLTNWMAKQFVRVVRLNRKYFRNNGASALQINNIKAAAERSLYAGIGLKVKDSKVSIIKGGWLNNLTDFQEPYQRVREISMQAVRQGVAFKDFSSQIKTYVSPKAKNGPIESHMYRNAYDAYNQFDRETGRQYADKLGYRAFIYQGGLINDSRPFCEERNDTVITIEEAELWRDQTWKGKNDNYDPLRDMGGHNCRHQPDYIPDILAIQLRPELKELWGM